MSDIVEFLYDLWGGVPSGEIVVNIFISVFVLILMSTIITFLFGIVSQFFRR